MNEYLGRIVKFFLWFQLWVFGVCAAECLDRFVPAGGWPRVVESSHVRALEAIEKVDLPEGLRLLDEAIADDPLSGELWRLKLDCQLFMGDKAGSLKSAIHIMNEVGVESIGPVLTALVINNRCRSATNLIPILEWYSRSTEDRLHESRIDSKEELGAWALLQGDHEVARKYLSSVVSEQEKWGSNRARMKDAYWPFWVLECIESGDIRCAIEIAKEGQGGALVGQSNLYPLMGLRHMRMDDCDEESPLEWGGSPKHSLRFRIAMMDGAIDTLLQEPMKDVLLGFASKHPKSPSPWNLLGSHLILHLGMRSVMDGDYRVANAYSNAIVRGEYRAVGNYALNIMEAPIIVGQTCRREVFLSLVPNLEAVVENMGIDTSIRLTALGLLVAGEGQFGGEAWILKSPTVIDGILRSDYLYLVTERVTIYRTLVSIASILETSGHAGVAEQVRERANRFNQLN